MTRRTASEVLHDLESRVARLEGRTAKLQARHIKVLERNLPRIKDILFYDDLPADVIRDLEAVKWTETLWSDVERWLGDAKFRRMASGRVGVEFVKSKGHFYIKRLGGTIHIIVDKMSGMVTRTDDGGRTHQEKSFPDRVMNKLLSGLNKWERGAMVQDALGFLDPATREWFMTGTRFDDLDWDL